MNHRIPAAPIPLQRLRVTNRLVPLVLVGLAWISAHAAQAAELRAGVARADITDRRVPVNDPLYAKALVVKSDSTTVVLITIDAVAIGELGRIKNDFLGNVRAKLKQELGIAPSSVLITASHCHGVVCPEVEARTLEAVRQAWQGVVPVRVGAGVGHENRIMENRRLRLKDGRESDVRHAYSLVPDEAVAGIAPTDDEIGLVRLDRKDGRPLAAIYNFACHPIQRVPSGANSADITGFASKVIEEEPGRRRAGPVRAGMRRRHQPGALQERARSARRRTAGQHARPERDARPEEGPNPRRGALAPREPGARAAARHGPAAPHRGDPGRTDPAGRVASRNDAQLEEFPAAGGAISAFARIPLRCLAPLPARQGPGTRRPRPARRREPGRHGGLRAQHRDHGAAHPAPSEPGPPQNAPGPERGRRPEHHRRGSRRPANRRLPADHVPRRAHGGDRAEHQEARREAVDLRRRLHERLHLLRPHRSRGATTRATPRRTATACWPPSGRSCSRTACRRSCRDCERE